MVVLGQNEAKVNWDKWYVQVERRAVQSLEVHLGRGGRGMTSRGVRGHALWLFPFVVA